MLLRMNDQYHYYVKSTYSLYGETQNHKVCYDRLQLHSVNQEVSDQSAIWAPYALGFQ